MIILLLYKKLLKTMKEVLKDREKSIVELRFGLNGKKPKTQHEIAEMMGISRSYVSRIETKAIGKLAKEFKEWGRQERNLKMVILNVIIP